MSAALNIEVIPLTEVPVDRLLGSEPQRPLVLVVDDEPVIADSLSIILKKNGFSVLTAYDGESALELAKLTPPDLLLSDVMLGPGIDGIELAIAVVQGCPNCRVLLFSGHATTKDLLETARKHGHKFTLLSKPLHPYSEALMRALPDALRAGAPLLSIAGQAPTPASLPRGCRFHPRCPYAEEACRFGDAQLAQVSPWRTSACLRWQILAQ